MVSTCGSALKHVFATFSYVPKMLLILANILLFQAKKAYYILSFQHQLNDCTMHELYPQPTFAYFAVRIKFMSYRHYAVCIQTGY